MINQRSTSVLLPASILCLVCFLSGITHAENEGLEDLDQATELKLKSTGLGDLTQVIQLIDSAFEKGLDKDNSELAELLLVATLLERASIFSAQVLDRSPPHPQWPKLRVAALGDLKRILDIDDNQIQAHLLVGRLLTLPQGDREEARASFTKVIDNDATDVKTKAQAYVYRGNVQTDDTKGLADINRAVEMVPQDAEILRSRALYLMRLNRFEDALTDLDKVLEIDPKHAPTHEARGLALIMLKRFDDALAALDRAVELAPENASPHINRGRALALQGEFEKASAAIDKSIELNPKIVSAWMFRIQLQLAQGQFDAAMQSVDEVLKLRPKWDQATRIKAEILAGTGRIEEAIKFLEADARERDKNTDLQLLLAMYYMVQNQSRQAIVLYTEILAREKDNARALRNRADAYLNIGKHAEAIADYERANQLQPDDSGILNNFAWVLATSPNEALRNGKRAIELANKACELTQFEAAHILSTLAASYAETGDFEAAMKWATKAIEANRADQDDTGNPNDPEELEHLERELKSYQAKEPWRELLEEEPSDKPADEPADEPDSNAAPARTIDF